MPELQASNQIHLKLLLANKPITDPKAASTVTDAGNKTGIGGHTAPVTELNKTPAVVADVKVEAPKPIQATKGPETIAEKPAQQITKAPEALNEKPLGDKPQQIAKGGDSSSLEKDTKVAEQKPELNDNAKKALKENSKLTAFQQQVSPVTEDGKAHGEAAAPGGAKAASQGMNVSFIG